jgi:RNA polymerase-binding transcription factor DksA
MKKADTERYREQLQRLMTRVSAVAYEITKEVRSPSGGASGGSLTNAPVHLGDSGTEEFLHDVNAVLLENEQYILSETRAALARMENGSFGRCESCDKKIAVERLKAMPYTRYCVSCAELNVNAPAMNINHGRPLGPADTLAPEGEMEEDRRSMRRTTMEARDRPRVLPDVHAAGTAGGGTAIGGLAGTNVGRGDPAIAALHAAAGSSHFDRHEDDPEDDAAESGRSGGAIGGTPARKRAK